jgi:hypothetical protein
LREGWQGRKDFEERKIDFCILKYAKIIVNCTNKSAVLYGRII